MCPSCGNSLMCSAFRNIPKARFFLSVSQRFPTEHHFHPFTFYSQMGLEGTNVQQPPCSKAVFVLPCRFAYKDEYEKFKLYLTIILLIVSFSCRFLLNSR